MRKRLISMVLAVSMAVSIMPAPAFASGGGQQSETVIGQEIDQQNSSDDYAEVDSLDNLTYTNNVCKIRLTENIVMTTAVTVNSGNRLTIDLNGHTLTAPENDKAFRIQDGALTIKDSIGTGVIQGSGTVTSYGGNGGAIWMSSGDSNNALTLTGGTIRGFTAKYGAGVYMGNGTFNMTGGAIQDCLATDGGLADGGGVYVSGGSFEMSDGTISACKANNAGGGVYVSSGSFKMSGGSIEDCTAHEGAGVKVYASSGETASFSMSGSGEIKNCNTDGVSISAIGNGTPEFTMAGGTIEGSSGYGVWVAAGSAVMSGGSVIKGSERYDIYIGRSAALTVNNTSVGGTVMNMGAITGQGNAEFTGTVENSGNAGTGKITGCKIHRIEHRSPYKGTIENSTWDEYVYLLGYSWPTAKIPSAAGESISLKVPSYISTPAMTNTLEIPAGVTVTVDLAGKPISADADASDIKIINHGTLTLIDSSTGGTLSIPIENDGVLNANGGTVTGEVTNKGTIQATGTPVTQFTGTLVNEEGASVTAGNFMDCTITNNGGTIGGDAILEEKPDPEQPGAGSEDGGAGAVIAALAVGTAVVGGGILLAHSYIQNNLPEGFAVPETRQELAVVLWNMAGKPEPASQQTYTDVQDEEVLKAVCWAVENELVTPETESTLGADVRVNRLQVIRAMYQTNKRKK